VYISPGPLSARAFNFPESNILSDSDIVTHTLLTMRSFSLLSLLFLSFATLIYSAVVTYDWELTWVNANPDGRLVRPVMGVNGEFPCPAIHVNVGDQLVVNLKNSLGNESTSIHWHGIHQEGTNAMDGPTGATQCPIPPGSSFTYDFTVCAMHIML
jgi:iron transport multicopper oxidase